MSSLFQPTNLRNHTSRNGFDLSKKVSFTAKAGELLPVYTQEVLPGDVFKVDVQHFLRTQPLNTASFVRMLEYYDFYFVPYRLLWRFAPQFFTQMENSTQSAIDSRTVAQVGNVHPYLTSDKMISDIKELHSWTNQFGFNRGDLANKLCGYLGYYFLANPSNYESTPLSEISTAINPFPLLAYQKVYTDHFRNSQWEDTEPYTYNVDYCFGSNPVLSDGFSAQQDGSLLTPYDLRYCDYKKDIFTGLIPSSQYGAVSTLGLSSSVDSSQLKDFEVKELYRIYGSMTEDSYTSSTVDALFAPADGASWSPSNTTNLAKLMVQGDSSSKLNAMHVITPSAFKTILDNAVKAVSSSFNILQLRKAEALQRFKEIQLSNETDYASQIKAMFGVDVSDILSGLSLYLGGVSSDINVSEVVNTSLDSNDSQADIKGKGTSAGHGFVDFTAKEHGIIMCIYHVLPYQEYDSLKLTPLVRKTSFDLYAQPVFDRLGYEALSAEYFLYTADSDTLAPASNIVLGYNPRYIEYKTDFDIVLGDFSSQFGGTSLDWNSPLHVEDLIGSYDSSGSIVQSNKLSWSSFKVNPHLLDSIFGVEAGSKVDTDQFLITSFFDVKAVRNLDRDGMPY